MSHVLTVTSLPDDTTDDVGYTLEGPHTGACMVWMPCEVELVSITIHAGLFGMPMLHGHQRSPRPHLRRTRRGRCPHEVTEEEEDMGGYEAHGAEHQMINGDWMTDTGRCAAHENDPARDDLESIALEHGLGRHLVDIDYWGDEIWNATYVGPVPA
jgi:hypothetical protein